MYPFNNYDQGEDGDRIMGLDIGSDDYIVKPFSPEEVSARNVMDSNSEIKIPSA